MKDFHRKLFLYYLVMVPEIISIKNGRILKNLLASKISVLNLREH